MFAKTSKDATMRLDDWRNLKRLLGLALGAVVIAVAAPIPALAGPSHGPKSTSEFRGVNWADPRDNYADDEVVPSGLSTEDDYRTTYDKASDIVLEFRHELKANTVRLPINPSSVGTDWWESYQGAIDAATRHGFKVILSYWEADNAKDGRADDQAAFDAMWETVVAEYGKNPHVYFEIMNEPFGYTLDEWVSVADGWLDDHAQVPRKRVIVSGTGYNDDVTGVGAATELDGTLLSLHFYGFWADHTTEEEWKANLLPRIGSYGWRTLVSEAGSPMTTGLNYGNHEGDVSTVVPRRADRGGSRSGHGPRLLARPADERRVHADEPGRRRRPRGDQRERAGADPVGLGTSQEGAAQRPASDASRRAARERAARRVRRRAGLLHDPGTTLGLWHCNGGGNQSFNWTPEKQLTVYADLCVAPVGAVSAGSQIMITDCTGAIEQQWELSADLTISSVAVPDLCLATTTDQWSLTLATCDATAPTQQWTRG